MSKQLKIFLASIALLLPITGPAEAISGGTPGVPIDPHVSSRTAATITLEWDAPLLDPGFVTRYEVQYSSDEGETWIVFNESNKTDTQAVIDTFLQGDQYLVSVASVGTGGQSSWVSARAAQEDLYSAVDSGLEHTCAVTITGEVKCWGSNSHGWLGDGTSANSNIPVSVKGLHNAVSVSAGENHSCAVLDTGQIRCWGDNGRGQLGDGTYTSSSTPVIVKGISNATSVALGSVHTCATAVSGEVKCWGDNGVGQSADGLNGETPGSVSGITNAVYVSAGPIHTCALLETQEIKCWGANADGQLGDGTTAIRTTPVLVQGISNATNVSVGSVHTCASLSTGELKCWGRNEYGQLGDATKVTRIAPVHVQDINNATNISVGANHSCALLASKESKCWGQNDVGQLGDNSETNRTAPTIVENITQATDLSAGYLHTCAVINTGEITCWGNNVRGQLGDGSESRSLAPSRVVTLSKSIIKLPMAPTPPSEISFDAQSTTGLRISWIRDSFSDGLVIDNYGLETSTDSQSWTSYDTTQLSKNFTGLQTASAICARVRVHSSAGWGEFSEVACSQTTGTRTMRFRFEKESGETVSGGSVRWGLSDNTYVGAQALGVTSNGVLEFPRVAAGLGIITASKLVMGDGTLVSGSWELSLGYATHTVRIPEAPSVAQRKVRVVLPNGLPVAGAMVSVAVTSQITSDAFTFRASSPKEGGTTDAKGEFVAVGYSNGNPTATISYNDGVLIQNKTVTLTSEVTEVTLDEMPWLELASSSTTAIENALVPIAVNVGAVAPLAAYRALGMDPYAMSGISVSVVPPKGSVQKCAKKVLSAKTNASGKATLKVCATKSGVYTIKGRGAAATGAFTLKVKGAAPMPVTSLSGITPAASTAKIAWNAPTYTGGAPIKNYTVTIVGGGKTFKKVVTTRTVTFTGLKRATVYNVSLVATTKNGTSDKATTSVSVA